VGQDYDRDGNCANREHQLVQPPFPGPPRVLGRAAVLPKGDSMIQFQVPPAPCTTRAHRAHTEQATAKQQCVRFVNAVRSHFVDRRVRKVVVR
jgi:hypothetical protein